MIFIPIVCCKSVARRVPVNYILLVTFTFCETFFFAWTSSIYTTDSVIAAGFMTLGMTIALTVYAFRTKTDFTAWTSLIFVLFTATLMLVIMSIFITGSFASRIVAFGFVIIYAFYLIYDTQLIAGGK